MDAKKCNRCGTLFEPKPGDLVITELNEYRKPKSAEDGATGGQNSIYWESEEECDLCTPCSADLRAFLEPIQRPSASSS